MNKDIHKALEDFNFEDRGDITDGRLVPNSHVFTPSTFMDAIVKWIIADDQVSMCYFVGFFTDAFS